MKNQGEDMSKKVENQSDALKALSNVVVVVSKMVQDYLVKGTLNLPPNYSANNALKGAWLVLQETQTKDKQPVLQACTNESIIRSLLSMVIQALNPLKNQCYFIAYGKTLVMQPSYFGNIALVKRILPGAEISAAVVYHDDKFIYEFKAGKMHVVLHEQKIENINPKKIKAAYASVSLNNEIVAAEVMSFDQIKKSWEKSQTYEKVAQSLHAEFPEEMCKRTVINRVCKSIKNSADDSSLFIQSVKETEMALVEAEMENKLALEANSEEIDINESLPFGTETKPEEQLAPFEND